MDILIYNKDSNRNIYKVNLIRIKIIDKTITSDLEPTILPRLDLGNSKLEAVIRPILAKEAITNSEGDNKQEL